MRSRFRSTGFITGVALLCGLTAPAFAQMKPQIMIAPPPIQVVPRAQNEKQLLHAYREKLKPLRAEILAQKARDGGKLNQASKAEFQARLDELNDEFRRYVRKQHNRGVNGWGYQEG